MQITRHLFAEMPYHMSKSSNNTSAWRLDPMKGNVILLSSLILDTACIQHAHTEYLIACCLKTITFSSPLLKMSFICALFLNLFDSFNLYSSCTAAQEKKISQATSLCCRQTNTDRIWPLGCSYLSCQIRVLYWWRLLHCLWLSGCYFAVVVLEWPTSYHW